jgi:hypothetical protein
VADDGQWVATATLANGDPYVNPGVHIISIRWGKAYALDVSEDSQAVATVAQATITPRPEF